MRINKIYLTGKKGKDKFVIVDKEDFKKLNKFKWYLNNGGYAVSKINPKRYGYNSLMHKVIMNTPDSLDTDHINHNKLDNRKKNLRIVTHAVNMSNMKLKVNNTSGYKGVSWNKARQRWQAYIKINYVKKHLGYFDNIISAKNARKFHEVEVFRSYE